MNLAQARKSISNLEKVKGIIEVSKFATLQELSKLSKVTNTALEFSVVAKDIFQRASEKYNVKSRFFNKSKGNKTVWIYITTDKTLLSTSNDSLEKTIDKTFNKNTDVLITIGEPSDEFAKKKKIPQELHFDKGNENTLELSASIATLFDSGQFDKVKVVYHSGDDEPTILLPVSEATINADPSIEVSSKSKFFPSLHEAMDILSHTYVSETMSAIISQATYFATKEKLIRHEQSIKSIEEKIEEKRIAAIKHNRKVSTEELILITGNAKRNAKKGESNEK